MKFSTKTVLRWVGKHRKRTLKKVLIYLIDDREVSKAKFRREEKAALKRIVKQEYAPQTNRGGASAWPLVSDALAVHPDQIPEAIESAKRKGVPTEFDKMGRPIFTSRAHRKSYCEKYHFFDRNGGYGDAARGAGLPISYGDEGEAV